MKASCALLGLLNWRGLLAGAVNTCPGSINVKGYGPVVLTNALWNVPGERAGVVEVDQASGAIIPGMKGRTYFATSCDNASYSFFRYASIPLLGNTLRYTTDMKGAGCGCNAALYLTSLKQNALASGCYDYYCDANSVCGPACAEIDLQEANMVSWRSTLHLWDDGSGIGEGYGGGGKDWNGPRAWTPEDYGPNSNCIRTTKPFQVAISFHTNWGGQLEAMVVELSQDGCKLSTSVGKDGYNYNNRLGMFELTAALEMGMTPIVSYWSAKDLLWMDGKGQDGRGPCDHDAPEACGSSVKFYDFSVGPIEGTVQHI